MGELLWYFCFQFVGLLPGGYGISLYCDFAPLAVSLWLLLYLRMWGIFFWWVPVVDENFPGGSDGKVSAYNMGDPGSIPGSGRFPGEGNGTPL